MAPVHAGAPSENTNPKPPRADLVLATPDYLPKIARELLRKRMERHGRDQSRLVLAVTLLQRDVVKSIAGDIAAEPRIVRPISEGRDDLNAALPERFFVLQDALRLRAKDLAANRSFASLRMTLFFCGDWKMRHILIHETSSQLSAR